MASPLSQLVRLQLPVSLSRVKIPFRHLNTSPNSAMAKRWTQKTKAPFQSELRNPVAAVYGGSEERVELGFVYDKKPFKMSVEKYRVYDWCGCGLSRGQPICDGTCRNPYIQRMVKGGPVRYIAPETRDVWFCNCKQTGNRPFCDGTHRTSTVVAEANTPGKFELWEPRAGLPAD